MEQPLFAGKAGNYAEVNVVVKPAETVLRLPKQRVKTVGPSVGESLTETPPETLAVKIIMHSLSHTILSQHE
jgi:hypothetical protein